MERWKNGGRRITLMVRYKKPQAPSRESEFKSYYAENPREGK
jgi:hypothetical protein